MDHAQLVHAQWLLAARNRLAVFVERIASKDNIADLPSRAVRVRCLHFGGAACVYVSKTVSK